MVNIPNRKTDALSGSQFMQSLGGKDFGGRDDLITSEILQGNIPNFLRKFVPVNVSEGTNNLTYFVMPDYISLGNDQDYIRVPLGGAAAQRIADAFGCMLPTAKMSNQIWKAAANKVPPKPMSSITSNINGKQYNPSEFVKHKLTDTDSFIEHNRLIQEQLSSAKPGQLVAGHKKDIVLSNNLSDNPNRVAIHGMHDANGKAIQGASWKHDIAYRDYSHGIRLIDKNAILNGKPTLLSSILQDPKTAQLISDEGPLKFMAYNYKQNPSQELANKNKPVKTDDLVQKINDYLDQISKTTV